MKKILLIIMLLFSLNVVKAESITLENIKDKFNEVSFTVNGEIQDHNLIIKNSNYDITLKFENNILESTKTYDNLLNSAKDLTMYSYVTKSIALLKGYSYKDIDYYMPKINEADLEKNGYAIIRKNNTVTFKIDISKFNFALNYIDADKPEIKLTKLNDGEVKINVKSNEKSVDLYRSIDNKNYEYISTIEIIDNLGSYIDYNLDNAKYYYKAVVSMADNYSDIEEINLNYFDNVDDGYVDETTDNPLTGYQEFVAVSMLLIIMIIEIICNISFKKKVYK